MINLNTAQYMASNTVKYWFVRLSLIFALLTLPFIGKSFGSWIGAFVVVEIFLGIPFLIYFKLEFNNMSFILDDQKLTINTGIITKRSRSIPFGTLQNVSTTSGLLARMFNIAAVAIWTSSPSQIHIVNSGKSGSHSENRPDGHLFLSREDGNWLKDFLLSRPKS